MKLLVLMEKAYNISDFFKNKYLKKLYNVIIYN